MHHQPKSFNLPFIKKEKIATDTYLFYFDRSSETFDFFPGQYVRIVFPSVTRYESRFFTIASSPLNIEHLIITTKTGNSEFKKTLFSLQSGMPVTFFGPNGGIFLDEHNVSDRVFLAGGLGIVPFYSMIKYASEKRIPINMTLIVSFSKEEDMIYSEELIAIAEKFPNIKIIYTITKPTVAWKGERGRISEDLIKKYITDIIKPIYSIVGFPEMVSATEELVEQMGVPLKNIKIEPFTGY